MILIHVDNPLQYKNNQQHINMRRWYMFMTIFLWQVKNQSSRIIWIQLIELYRTVIIVISSSMSKLFLAKHSHGQLWTKLRYAMQCNRVCTFSDELRSFFPPLMVNVMRFKWNVSFHDSQVTQIPDQFFTWDVKSNQPPSLVLGDNYKLHS